MSLIRSAQHRIKEEMNSLSDLKTALVNLVTGSGAVTDVTVWEDSELKMLTEAVQQSGTASGWVVDALSNYIAQAVTDSLPEDARAAGGLFVGMKTRVQAKMLRLFIRDMYGSY